MGLFGEKLAERDVAIGMMLSLALGLGLLFLHFYTSAATQATALLFGNVLGVDNSALVTLVLLAVASLAALAFIARPLVFASLQSELAEARGVPLRFVSAASSPSSPSRSPNARRSSACCCLHADGRPRGGGEEPDAPPAGGSRSPLCWRSPRPGAA